MRFGPRTIVDLTVRIVLDQGVEASNSRIETWFLRLDGHPRMHAAVSLACVARSMPSVVVPIRRSSHQLRFVHVQGSWWQTRRSFLGCYAQSLVDDHEVAYVNLVVLVRGQEVKTADFGFLSRALMATS
jgi:hypothetical protein